MKLLTALLLAYSSTASAASHTFKYSNGTSVTVEALTRHEGYKAAATKCFQSATGGTYPGADAGLDLIDMCANPLNYK